MYSLMKNAFSHGECIFSGRMHFLTENVFSQEECIFVNEEYGDASGAVIKWPDAMKLQINSKYHAGSDV